MKIPSPCIDICKYKLEARCIGCFMTKKEKKTFKSLKKQSDRRKFIANLIIKEEAVGKSEKGQAAYRRKCEQKGIKYNKIIISNEN